VDVGIDTSERDGATVVALTGELDYASTEAVEQQLIGIEGGGAGWIVIDLRELAFIDSTGLSLLINTDRRARKADRRLTIVSGAGASKRLIRTTGLDARLEVVADLPAADARM
jgi:anti-sigma B factor antagonist